MTRKCHSHRQQTNPWHQEEETQNTATSQLKHSNQLSLPQQNLVYIVNLCKTASKACVKQPISKRQKIGFQDRLSLNAGEKYCRMLQGEHSAILSTFIKLPFVTMIFVLSIFEWLFYTGFTVPYLFRSGSSEYSPITLSIYNVFTYELTEKKVRKKLNSKFINCFYWLQVNPYKPSVLFVAHRQTVHT